MSSQHDLAEVTTDLAETIVSALRLDVKPADIEPDAPLFGEGLGLDSIDALEIAICVSERYGIQLRSDDPDNKRIFASLRSLAAHIAAQLPRRVEGAAAASSSNGSVSHGSTVMLQTRAALLQRSLDDTLFWRPDEAVSVITGSVFLRAAAR